jgi:hypothetical protein
MAARISAAAKRAAAAQLAAQVWPLPNHTVLSDGWYVAWSRPQHALLKRVVDGRTVWCARMSDGTDIPCPTGGAAQKAASAHQLAHKLARKPSAPVAA